MQNRLRNVYNIIIHKEHDHISSSAYKSAYITTHKNTSKNRNCVINKTKSSVIFNTELKTRHSAHKTLNTTNETVTIKNKNLQCIKYTSVNNTKPFLENTTIFFI